MSNKTETEKSSSQNKMTNNKKYQTISTVIVFAVIGVIYITTLATLFPNMPIITYHAETMPNYVEIYPPFRMDEINYYKISKNIISGDIYREGSIEKSFSIGFPLIAVPFTLLWGEMGGYAANTVIMLLSLLLFFLTARRFVSHKISILMTFLFAFATLNWFYAVSCYTEPLAQLLVIAGFYFAIKGKTFGRTGLSLFLAGIFTGLIIFVRAHYILITAPFFIFLWVRFKDKVVINHEAFWFAGGVSFVLLFWLVRNSVFFGNPLVFEYTRMVAQITGRETGKGYSGNVFWGLHELLFDKYHGLLTITPIFLLFPSGLVKMWRKEFRNEVLILLSSVAVIVLFIATSPYPFTEFGLGSRHMVPILPLIFLPSVFFIERRKFNKIILTLLALYSFYHAGIGWFTGGGEYIGEMGIFTGLQHQKSSRAIILARKKMIPKRYFNNNQEIVDTFDDSITENDYMKLFQTLHPDVLENIIGNERNFVNYIRAQSDRKKIITSIDPQKGIRMKDFQFIKE